MDMFIYSIRNTDILVAFTCSDVTILHHLSKIRVMSVG